MNGQVSALKAQLVKAKKTIGALDVEVGERLLICEEQLIQLLPKGGCSKVG